MLRQILRHTVLSGVPPLLLAAAVAAEPGDPAGADGKAQLPAGKPLVHKLENGNYRIGKITFNKNTREITLPARTNIVGNDVFIEYLLVHLNGEKIHEALLVSEVDPTNLNIALKLLNYKESRELFRINKPDGTPGDKYPDVPGETRAAARFGVYVTWKDKGVERTRPVTQWLQHNGSKKPMPATPWVYNGSYVHNNRFKAKLTGSMLTVFPDIGAIANYPGKDREDDTIWIPAANLPRSGSEVTVTLKPWPSKP